jgi:DNA repair protein RecO (recombination protein O)
MSVDKTIAFVLKTLPYRESSGIFHLLTIHHGLIHGIAKGIRKKKTSASFLERGFLIETMLYIKPHRDLCILGDIHILNFYPKTRVCLIGSALRDAMFEMIMATVSVGHPYPELFHILNRFLDFIEVQIDAQQIPPLLWRFYQEFASVMGFGFNLKTCIVCEKSMLNSTGGYLVVEKGAVACESCTQNKNKEKFISKQVIEYLYPSDKPFINPEMQAFSSIEVRRLTRLFALYCQHHCDSRFEHKALAFLDSLLATGPN